MEFCHIFSLMLICMVLSTFQTEQIIADPRVTAYIGGDVRLHCESKSMVNITQVQWKWKSAEKKEESIAIYNPTLGTHYPNSTFLGRVTLHTQSLHHVSISVTGVKLTDKGNFICHYTAFPSGSMQTTTTLIVKAKEVRGQSSYARVTGIIVCILLLISCLAIAVITMMKNRRILQAANPRPASPSVVYENAYDSPYSEVNMDCTYTTQTAAQPIPRGSDNVYAGLQFSHSSPYSTLEKSGNIVI